MPGGRLVGLALVGGCSWAGALSGPPTVPFMPDQELLRRARLANALGSS